MESKKTYRPINGVAGRRMNKKRRATRRLRRSRIKMRSLRSLLKNIEKKCNCPNEILFNQGCACGGI